MYKNCNVFNSKTKHKYTLIMLHPMFSSSEYFYDFYNYFNSKIDISNIFNSIKFILPNAPNMNIDYPDNKIYNKPSWYNYYTCYDNIVDIDIIDVMDYKYQTNRILDIIHNEAFVLNNYDNIFIAGTSQGGTLLFNILNKLPCKIGGIFCIKSIYMYKYTEINFYIETPIFIFTTIHDDIYNYKLQKISFNKIKDISYNFNWIKVKNFLHNEYNEQENIFIINNLLKIIN